MNLFFLLCTLMFTRDVWAFKFVLMDDTLQIGNGVVSTTATIVNDGSGMVAIEAGARVRTYSIDGIESSDTLAEDLIVIPSQMIVPPGGEQVVSIRWLGPSTIATEQAYRLLIEYVAVSEDKLKGLAPDDKQAMMQVNYRVAKAFYVLPKGTKAHVTLREFTKLSKDGKDVLQVSLENVGNKHQIVHNMTMEFTTQSGEKISTSFAQNDMGGSVNILALTTRVIDIPWPASLENKEIVSATLIGFGE